MSNVAYLSKVNLPPSITLTPSVMFFTLSQCTNALYLLKRKTISVTVTKTSSMPEGQPCTRPLVCLER